MYKRQDFCFALTVPLLEEELDWAAAEVHTLAVEPQLAAVLALAAAKPTCSPMGSSSDRRICDSRPEDIRLGAAADFVPHKGSVP